MVTTFNKKDLSSFGNYLLSKERKQYFIDHPEPVGGSLEERLAVVNHSDVRNWLDTLKPDAVIDRLLDAPSRYKLSDLFRELKFGRPTADQHYLDKCIEQLEG